MSDKTFAQIYAAAKREVLGLYEELQNVQQNQPLFPGDTISHAQAAKLCALGYIQRNEVGDWVTTDKEWQGITP